MRQNLPWRCFWTIEIIGLLCLSGGEKFAISHVGFYCRIIAVIVLEPGLIFMESVVEKTLWGSRVSLTEMYWIVIGLGIAMNALLFGLILKLIATTHDKRRMKRLRE